MTDTHTFPAVPASIPAARAFAAQALSAVSASTRDTVLLMVSELATNAVEHATSTFRVTVRRQPDEIRVEVTDSGVGAPALQTPGAQDLRGRGLQIVDMLASQWGVSPTGRDGKTVWFSLSRGSRSRPLTAL